MTSKTHFKPKSAEKKLTLNFTVSFSNFFFRAQKLFLDRIRCSTRKMTSKTHFKPKSAEKKLILNFRVNFSNFFFRAENIFLD